MQRLFDKASSLILSNLTFDALDNLDEIEVCLVYIPSLRICLTLLALFCFFIYLCGLSLAYNFNVFMYVSLVLIVLSTLFS